MKAVNPDAKVDFIAPGDEGLRPEEQSILELTQLSADEDAYLADCEGSGERLMASLHLGLAGIRNFKGPDGTPVVLKRDTTKATLVGEKRPWVTDQITLIPFKVRSAAAGKIIRGVGLEKAEAKNS